MSVRTMARVWESSKHTGTELLMLLALADFADDQGNAYPAVGTLAAKCRTTPRHANRILCALRESGELEVRMNAGPRGTNLYHLTMPKPLTPMSPPDADVTPDTSVIPDHLVTLTSTPPTPDVHVPKPLTPMSDEPSMNHQEPSSRSKLPLCPHAAVVELFHEVLPEMPRVKLMGEPRKKALGSFWKWIFTERTSSGATRAQTADEALAWIRAYFERARSNDCLMGRTARGEGHRDWKCDLEFLLSDKGKRQVIEKTEEAAA
jgi:hypothetical protein